MIVAELIDALKKQNPQHVVYDETNEEIHSVVTEGEDVILSTEEDDEDDE